MDHHYGHGGIHHGHARHIGGIKLDTDVKQSVARDLGESATTFGLGVVHGRYAGMPEWHGIPLDFALAVLAKVIQYAPIPGKPAEVDAVAETVGRGALVYFTASIGQTLGQKWRAKSVGLTGAAPKNRAITQGATRHDARVYGGYDPRVLRQAIAGRH
jgi:hypothetical protein